MFALKMNPDAKVIIQTKPSGSRFLGFVIFDFDYSLEKIWEKEKNEDWVANCSSMMEAKELFLATIHVCDSKEVIEAANKGQTWPVKSNLVYELPFLVKKAVLDKFGDVIGLVQVWNFEKRAIIASHAIPDIHGGFHMVNGGTHKLSTSKKNMKKANENFSLALKYKSSSGMDFFVPPSKLDF